MKLVAALIVLLAVAPVTQAAPTQVAISVPPTQVLEGVTTLPLAPMAAPIRAQLVVKSNVPWILVARVTGTVSGVALRVENGSWTPLGAVTPVLQGSRGVHAVTYEVRSQGTDQSQISLILRTAEVAP